MDTMLRIKHHAAEAIERIKSGTELSNDLDIVNIYLNSLKKSRKQRSIHKVQRVKKQRFKA